jgi:putative spermidine/putrescine transport system substrate-binding protein
MSQDFLEDCIAILRGEAARGRISRRDLVAAGAALGLAPAAARAQANPREIVLVNYGGDATPAMKEAWGDPFTRDTGIPVAIDGSGPSLGRIRAMVESGRVTWDVCDGGPGTAIELGGRGLLEEMDWSVVDRTKLVDPKFAYRHGIANYTFSFVLAYDRAKVGDTPPASWADFWDVRRWPGKRTMWSRNILGICEAALMADGVAPAALYPLDVDRALRKLREIKPHLIGWQSGANSQDLLRSGEVVMGNVWNTRALLLHRETNGRIDWTWNQGILAPGVWVVPKGNPAGRAAAMRFIASTQDPARQVVLLRLMGQGPANPAATPLVPPELARFNPSSAENARVQVIFDGEWYGQHQARTLERWLDLLGS